MCDVRFCRDSFTSIILNINKTKKEICNKCWTAVCNGQICSLCLNKINVTPLEEYKDNFSGLCNPCRV